MSFSPTQIKELLKPINPSRIGRDGKGFSHVEAWDIRRRMNQIFGFGNWSSEVEEMELIYEVSNDTNKRWSVTYRAKCRVSVGDAAYSEWAAGDAVNYPSRSDAHDQAIKTAESQAFKRCCVNLGDQFGLSLYNEGSVEASVIDIVERVGEDSERVSEWLDSIENSKTEDDLSRVAKEIKGSDVNREQRDQLIDAYAIKMNVIKGAETLEAAHV